MESGTLTEGFFMHDALALLHGTLASTQQPSQSTCTGMTKEPKLDTVCSWPKHRQARCQNGFGKGLRAYETT